MMIFLPVSLVENTINSLTPFVVLFFISLSLAVVRLDCYDKRRRRPDLEVTVHDEDPKETEIEIQAFRNFLGEFDVNYSLELQREPIPAEDVVAGSVSEI